MSTTFAAPPPAPLIDLRWPIPTNTAAMQDGDVNVSLANATLITRGRFAGGSPTTNTDPVSVSAGFVGATSLRVLRFFQGVPMLDVDPGGGYLMGLPWLRPTGGLLAANWRREMGAVIDLWFRGDLTAGEDGWSLVFWDYVANATAAHPAAATALGGISLHRIAATGPNAFECRVFSAGGVLEDSVLVDNPASANAGMAFRVEVVQGPESVRASSLTVDATFPSIATTPIVRVGEWRFNGSAGELPLPSTVGGLSLAMCVHAPTAVVSTRGRVRSTGPVV